MRSVEIEDDQSAIDDLKSIRSLKSFKSRGSFRSELHLASSKNFDDDDPDVSGQPRASRGNHGAGAVSHTSHRGPALDEDILDA